jgi:hypothetical protein
MYSRDSNRSSGGTGRQAGPGSAVAYLLQGGFSVVVRLFQAGKQAGQLGITQPTLAAAATLRAKAILWQAEAATAAHSVHVTAAAGAKVCPPAGCDAQPAASWRA